MTKLLSDEQVDRYWHQGDDLGLEPVVELAENLQSLRAAVRHLRDMEPEPTPSFDAAWDALMALLPDQS